MDKIKFDFDEPKNKAIKIGGQRVEIRPYILTDEKTIISDLCCQQIKAQNGKDQRNSIHIARLVFDIGVVAMCSNIEIDGVKVQTKKNRVVGLTIDAKEPTLEKFEKSGIATIVEKNICNCEKIWDDVVKDVDIAINSLVALLDELRALIPSKEEQKDILDKLKTTFEEFVKQNPDIAREQLEKPIRETAIKKTRENREKEKLNRANSKKQ